jgi:hypothetical protein
MERRKKSVQVVKRPSNTQISRRHHPQHADKPPPPPTSWDKTIFAFSRNEIDERSHNDAMVLVVL